MLCYSQLYSILILEICTLSSWLSLLWITEHLYVISGALKKLTCCGIMLCQWETEWSHSLPPIVWGRHFFPKKLFMEGQKFLGKFMWGLFFMGGLIIISYQREGGGGRFINLINVFYSNLTILIFSQPYQDTHLKIKPRQFYRIMEGFILKVNSLRSFKGCAMFNFLHVDTDLRY